MQGGKSLVEVGRVARRHPSQALRASSPSHGPTAAGHSIASGTFPQKLCSLPGCPHEGTSDRPPLRDTLPNNWPCFNNIQGRLRNIPD